MGNCFAHMVSRLFTAPTKRGIHYDSIILIDDMVLHEVTSQQITIKMECQLTRELMRVLNRPTLGVFREPSGNCAMTSTRLKHIFTWTNICPLNHLHAQRLRSGEELTMLSTSRATTTTLLLATVIVRLGNVPWGQHMSIRAIQFTTTQPFTFKARSVITGILIRGNE